MNEVRVVLAEELGLGRIHLCECNSIHVNLGPVTVNLSPEAFTKMANMVNKATRKLVDVGAVADEQSDALKSGERRNHLTH